jgi:hypothetical protein
MEEWKIRQEIYHRTTTVYSDDLSQFKIEITDSIVEDAVRYFNTKDIGWIYPAKSYMVGICYARWLSDEFGNTPDHYLNDPMLLYGNDPYFVEYCNASEIYNSILEKIGGWNFDQLSGLVPDVKEYFLKEFLIDEPRI